VKRASRLVPGRARTALWAVAHRPSVVRAVHHPRWGNLRRLRPFSQHYGHDRGPQAIDRYYIDRFIAANVGDIRGRVLEVGEGRYARCEGSRLEVLDVLDIDPRNPRATVVADLDDPGSLPSAAFDCVVLTQTLQYVRDPLTSLRTIWSSVASGGVLLLTAPAAAKVDHDLRERDSWRILPVGMQRLLDTACEGADVTVRAHGNLLSTIGFLLGLASDELTPAELDVHDPLFPLVTTARAHKRAA
jgi:SAM-dependent methyltransferase